MISDKAFSVFRGQGRGYILWLVVLIVVDVWIWQHALMQYSTGIYASFVGGHNNMVNILHQLPDGTFVEHCFCIISRLTASAINRLDSEGGTERSHHNKARA